MATRPDFIYIVFPGVSEAARVTIEQFILVYAPKGWQLANQDDAQWLTPAPPSPVPDVLTRDELPSAVDQTQLVLDGGTP